MTVRIHVDHQQIAGFCARHQVAELSLFGSALRDDFGPDSDVDVLVRFRPEAHPTLFSLTRMENELRDLFGRDVDLVDIAAVEQSSNPYRRKAILSSYQVLHAA